MSEGFRRLKKFAFFSGLFIGAMLFHLDGAGWPYSGWENWYPQSLYNMEFKEFLLMALETLKYLLIPAIIFWTLCASACWVLEGFRKQNSK